VLGDSPGLEVCPPPAEQLVGRTRLVPCNAHRDKTLRHPCEFARAAVDCHRARGGALVAAPLARLGRIYDAKHAKNAAERTHKKVGLREEMGCRQTRPRLIAAEVIRFQNSERELGLDPLEAMPSHCEVRPRAVEHEVQKQSLVVV
jgi:hypothetical protein